MSGHSDIAFVDIETTGLDPSRHEVWEVALVLGGKPRVWHLPVKLLDADPTALRISGFHQRYRKDAGMLDAPTFHAELESFAAEFAYLTAGRHLAGAVVSFDEERLRRLLTKHAAPPSWHYHLIDVEALCVGYLYGIHAHDPFDPADDGRLPFEAPWRSSEISRMVGVNPDNYARHTALGDAYWALDLYRTVTGE